MRQRMKGAVVCVSICIADGRINGPAPAVLSTVIMLLG